MRQLAAFLLVTCLTLSACRDGLPPGTGGNPLVLWAVPSSGGGIPHDPVGNADRSVAYFVTPDYRLKKVRGATGQVLWDVAVGSSYVTFPQWNAALAGSVVAVTKYDLLAFDTATGAPRWTYASTDIDETGNRDQVAYSAIVSDGNTVFAVSRTARVHAIDALSGTARWKTDLREGRLDIGSLNPTYSGGTVYACTRNVGSVPSRGTLWALDAASGAVKWLYRFLPELPQQGSACYGSAAVWQDLVIQPQEDGRVFAFDQNTGAVRWIAPRVHDVSRSFGDQRWPAAGGTYLMVTSSANEGMIVVYDPATGTERWRYTANSGSLFPPALDDSTAYVDHGWIFASYDLASGKVRWQTPSSVLEPATVFKGKAVIAPDRIYVAGRNGSYALKK